MSRRGRRARRRGLRALLLVAAVLLGEVAARAFHDPRDADFLFDWYFADTRWERERRAAGGPVEGPGEALPPPPGGGPEPPPDDGLPRTADEYRGTFRLDAARTPGLPRVLVTGAGHLFAQDVPWGRALTERTQARLRFDGFPVEVWNLAVPGSTILNVERGQLDAIVAAQPDLVVLGHGGFNEALYAGIPEAWVLHPDKPAVNLALSSALLRFVLTRGARLGRALLGRPPSVKVPVPVFERSVRAVVGRLRAADIDVVLLQQVVIHPDIAGVWALDEMAPFRASVDRVGAELGLVVVDPADAFAPPLERWFVRQEYYSADAHDAIAAQLAPVLAARLPDPRRGR